MNSDHKPRRLRIVVSDEDTGEEITKATGVETLVMLVAPDTLRNETSRRILIGDPESSVQLLLDIVREVSKQIGRGTLTDPNELLDDHMLLEMTDRLPVQ